MANGLALNLIASVMDWDDVTATGEYAWLRMMSSLKYDTYAEFAAGAGFLEALVDWLRQFEMSDRATAYRFVKERLVFISSAEMRRVIEAFLPEIVTPYLRWQVANDHEVAPYEVWAHAASSKAFDERLRRCLFVGLSDGSRIDLLRRATAGRISQEQIVPMMNVDNDKWLDLGAKLRKVHGAAAKFDDVYLIDDFTALGTTFIRSEAGKLKGKLAKFERIVGWARAVMKDDFPVAAPYRMHIHHYVSTSRRLKPGTRSSSG